MMTEQELEDMREVDRMLLSAVELIEAAARFSAQTNQWTNVRRCVDAIDVIGPVRKPGPIPIFGDV